MACNWLCKHFEGNYCIYWYVLCINDLIVNAVFENITQFSAFSLRPELRHFDARMLFEKNEVGGPTNWFCSRFRITFRSQFVPLSAWRAAQRSALPSCNCDWSYNYVVHCNEVLTVSSPCIGNCWVHRTDRVVNAFSPSRMRKASIKYRLVFQRQRQVPIVWFGGVTQKVQGKPAHLIL